MLGAGLVEHADHRGRVGDVLAAGDGDEGALRQVRRGRAVLPRAHEVAGIDGRRGQLAGLRDVGAVPRAPGLAGLGAVLLGHGVAHGLERVAAVAEVARPVRHELELARLDLGAVLGGLEVAELRAQPVNGAVEAADLGVEAVDEAPQQALALVGDLEPVGRDALGQDAERLAHRVGGVVAIPHLAAVELVPLGGRAEQRRVLADGRGGGLLGVLDGVDVEGHDDLP